MYTNVIWCVSNNNWITETINIFRGIRQGCPLSCLIFIIAPEIMAVRIRSNERICGVTVRKKHIKISQLADDTTSF